MSKWKSLLTWALATLFILGMFTALGVKFYREWHEEQRIAQEEQRIANDLPEAYELAVKLEHPTDVLWLWGEIVSKSPFEKERRRIGPIPIQTTPGKAPKPWRYMRFEKRPSETFQFALRTNGSDAQPGEAAKDVCSDPQVRTRLRIKSLEEARSNAPDLTDKALRIIHPRPNEAFCAVL